jgi:hypothetical protein
MSTVTLQFAQITIWLWLSQPLQHMTGLFQKEEIKKGITSSSQQRLVIIPFLISLLKNEGTEQPCMRLMEITLQADRDDCIFFDELRKTVMSLTQEETSWKEMIVS